MADEQDDNEVLIEAVRSFPCIWNMSLREYKDNRVKENAWSKVSQKLGTSIDDSKRRWKNLRDKFVRERKFTIKRPTGTSGPPSVSQWKYYNIMCFMQDTVRHRNTSSNIKAIENSFPLESDEDINKNGTNDTENELISLSDESTNIPDLPIDVSRSIPIRSSSSPSPSPSDSKGNPPIKKRKVDNKAHVESAIIDTLKQIREANVPTNKYTDDEDYHFAMQVLASIKRFDSKKKALAKLHIHHYLTSVEYGLDSSNYGPMFNLTPPMYSSLPMTPQTSNTGCDQF